MRDNTSAIELLRILQAETDENHVLNATQLGSRLGCNRKTVYKYVDLLRVNGFDISLKKGTSAGYYIQDRLFQKAELKLLVDAVQASKAIPAKETTDLIRKIGRLTNKSEEKNLKHNISIYNRCKTENLDTLRNVDCIYQAISDNRRIRFQYCEWTVNKTLVPKHDGAFYDVSPWVLSWVEDNYYLIGFDEKSSVVKHFRIDKMTRLTIVDQVRHGQEAFQHFDCASYTKKTFGMFSGSDTCVTLSGDASMVGVVLDRFGKDIFLRPDGDGRFVAHVLVSVSPQFFGWLMGLGDRVQVVAPVSVRSEYKTYMKNLLAAYSA